MATLQARLTEIDRAMYEPTQASAPLAGLTMTDLLSRRQRVSGDLEKAEAEWLALSEELETLAG